MKVYNAKETAALLPYARLTGSIINGVCETVNAPQREHHAMPGPGDTSRTLISMPAWDDVGNLAVKLVNVSPSNTTLGAPGIAAIYILFEPQTGSPVMVIDGAELTARRTAAIAAVGGHHLAPPDAKTHLIVGAGAIARHLPGAYASLREFEHTIIWARRPEQAEALAAELEAEGHHTHVKADLAEAVSEADVISCATMARTPIIKGEWLRDAAHVDLIGAYLPDMREGDDNVLKGAEIWADSLPGALTDSGELADPIARGIIARSDVRGDLTQLVRRRQLPTDGPQRTVFKSVGNARWDFLCTRYCLAT